MSATTASGGSRTPQRETVLAQRCGPVLVLTLNRPERLNAWNDELETRCFTLLAEADADPEVRATVLTGAGRGFCAGADMDDLRQVGAATDLTEGDVPKRERPRWFPLTLRKPLIAAINGAAAGLGLVQALYCDIRLSTPDAKLTTAFARRGLIAEYGIAWLLPRLVGPGRAMDLLLSGRVVRGSEAYEMGLVNRVVEPERLLDTAVDYATELATWCSPASMSVMKRQVLQALDTDFATAVGAADALMLEAFRHPDATEGVTSYLERRAPAFRPLDPK
ncbi:enoyl-CoA hydratase-related protein [Streptomyces sp. MZ04]|uniref:enoyl-CoA hydratase-related protein n=1 Tax=Streptomyces sp. MZ04 TaxID=2559236 RepID=UPI00107EB724|nr:enoyl-CoA hydratase-related protein [Streptomyces sp. MZ04]TGB15653.1 enoyl-CoA hydratase [Streptomyces sp. MZ04]